MEGWVDQGDWLHTEFWRRRWRRVADISLDVATRMHESTWEVPSGSTVRKVYTVDVEKLVYPCVPVEIKVA